MSDEPRPFWNPNKRRAYLDRTRQKSAELKRQQDGVPVAEELEVLWARLTDNEKAFLSAMVRADRRSVIAPHDHSSLRDLVSQGLLTYPQGHGGNWMRAARTSYAVPPAIWEKLQTRHFDDPAVPELSPAEAEELLDRETQGTRSKIV